MSFSHRARARAPARADDNGDDNGDDNADDNRAPAAQSEAGSGHRSKPGEQGCVLLGVKRAANSVLAHCTRPSAHAPSALTVAVLLCRMGAQTARSSA